MEWYVYLAHFFAGVFLTNGVPHFINGISGRKSQTPFASPSGVGESSAIVNVLWGSANFVIGYLLLMGIGHFPYGPSIDSLVVGLGIVAEIVEMATQAPSSFNLQPWSLIILKTLEEKMRLRKVAWDQPKVSEAPVVFIVLADRDGWKKGHPFVEKNFREMVKAGGMKDEQHDWFINACQGLYGTSPEREQAFACKNAGFFAMALMFAAKHLGLDTHPMDGFDHDAVRKEFQIPENYWIPLLMAVGYFDGTKTLLPPKWRKTYEEIVLKSL